MLYLAFIAAISWVAGFLGGLTGTGGIIMPPLMMALYGIEPRVAMAMAQVSYILPSTLSVIMFMRKGQLDLRIAIPLALAGFFFSWIGADKLKPMLEPGGLSLVFALCIVISGAVMLWKSSFTLSSPLLPPKRGLVLFGAGAAVGVLSGITGSGSSAMLVPALSFLGFNLLNVLAACQTFSVLASAAGTIGNLAHMELNFAHIGVMVATQLAGMHLGVRLAQRTDTTRLKKIVGLVCLAAGLFMAARAALDVWGQAANRIISFS